MAKTNTEKIDELSQLMQTMIERVDTLRRDIETGITKTQRVEDSVNGLVTRAALAEERIAEIRKGIDEGGRRRWAVVPSIVSAALGAMLALLGQIVLRGFFPETQRAQHFVKVGTPGPVKRGVP